MWFLPWVKYIACSHAHDPYHKSYIEEWFKTKNMCIECKRDQPQPYIKAQLKVLYIYVAHQSCMFVMIRFEDVPVCQYSVQMFQDADAENMDT